MAASNQDDNLPMVSSNSLQKHELSEEVRPDRHIAKRATAEQVELNVSSLECPPPIDITRTRGTSYREIDDPEDDDEIKFLVAKAMKPAYFDHVRTMAKAKQQLTVGEIGCDQYKSVCQDSANVFDTKNANATRLAKEMAKQEGKVDLRKLVSTEITYEEARRIAEEIGYSFEKQDDKPLLQMPVRTPSSVEDFDEDDDILSPRIVAYFQSKDSNHWRRR